ncbi:ATP-binding protein [Actinophytocola oryzae]|uniref:Putative ATPase n=1 Tax=Actinophytocola oryzae TaxID=502181 RepID=A0A4R7W165_9PSEU|nr:LuxR family transcriptional regulator [Actinophytocola oryzae]TDV56276.1 putative ATPase [Actinophytocola oryzae]
MQTRAPSIVGRDTELGVLDRALADARIGRGGAVFLVGEPGIGKSRLANEASGRAFAAGMRVLRGRGSTIGPTVPFRPLAEALLSLSRVGDPEVERDLGPYRLVLGRLVPEWANGEPQQGGESLVILAEGVVRLASALGRERGCLLILDDLQDADAETLAVLEYLVDNIGTAPTVLVATIRNEPCDALDLAQAVAQRGSGVVLSLDRLGRDEVRGLVASCLDITSEDVPAPALARLWESSAGNPFVLEELLHSMVSTGLLRRGTDGWQLVGGSRTEVPATLVRSIARRTDRLGLQGRMLLSVAAVLGPRFPLPVVQRVTGMDDRTLVSHLHAGVAAQLVTTDEPAPDWYAFQHPLTSEALLAQLTPTDRAELSRRAADAIEEFHPGLPGEWCQLVAALRVQCGQKVDAAALFAEAGRRALAAGAAASAVSLLARSDGLLEGHEDVDARADLLESLLYALAEAGQFDHAFQLVERLEVVGALDLRRRAMLHVRLAWVAEVAGRYDEGTALVATARELLGPSPADADAASLAAVAADLALGAPDHNRTEEAEELARSAAEMAERADLPAIVCQAWQTIGDVARERDLAEASRCYERARVIAEEHRLPIWRIYALVRLAGNELLATSDPTSLHQARLEALRVGAISIGYVVDTTVAMHTVHCGEFKRAAELADECYRATSRLRLAYVSRHALLTRATLAAHQGRRRELERALAEFRAAEGEQSQEPPLRVMCAVLEEDWERLPVELARACDREGDNPSTLHLSGRHGLYLLLRVLTRDADWPQYEEVCVTSAGRMRWNRQFVVLARAVLLGRSGRGAEALASVEEAQDIAAPFAMARPLGLRLVAEAAHTDGWGEPEKWLRSAEEYFHHASVPAVASACRALLRQVGASVQQRRRGTERVPDALRGLGVTIREYEVFELLVNRLGNKAIGARLHISPRTVEKHVASLVVKTGQTDREALNDYAKAFFSG